MMSRLSLRIAALLFSAGLTLGGGGVSRAIAADSGTPVERESPPLAQARSLMAAGQFRGARSTLEQALRQSPGDPRLLLGQAELSLRLRKPRRALELARQAAAAGLRDDPRLLAARAEAALERLELEEAERCAMELVRLEPERPAGAAWLARVLAVAGRPAEAYRALLPWLERCPLAPEVLVARAVLHEQAGAASAAASLRRLALRMGAIETGQ